MFYNNKTPPAGRQDAVPMDAFGAPYAVAAPVSHQFSVGNVAPLKPSVAPTTGFRDWPFAVLFLANIAAIVVLVVVYGTNPFKSGNDVTSTSNVFPISNHDMKTIVAVCGVLSLIAAVLSFVILQFTVRYARQMIFVALWASVFWCFACAIFAVAKKQYVLAIITALLGLLSVCYAIAVRDRIPFAAANLQVAGSAIRSHPSNYLIAFLFLIVQIVWVFIWFAVVVGVTNRMSQDSASNEVAGTTPIGGRCRFQSDCSTNYCLDGFCQQRNAYAQLKKTSYVAYFFLLVSFFWGVNVFTNIIHVTVAGTVATWWYTSESKGATGASLKRATTTSLGSICLGSLIVAILQALRQLAEEARRQGDCAACIAECILNCLQSLMETFNRWAFVYVGIYGYKFVDAGKAVMQLFHDRGFDAIINDSLVSTALGFAAFGVGCLCALLALAYNYIDTANQFQYSQYILPFAGLLFGIGISLVPLSVIDSAVATIYVCFAEDPAALQQSHPEHFDALMTEWQRMYPEIMLASGYYVVA
ncbi:putative choline transporter, neither null mutation nor overexpression affects choline transport [Aphanomyces cochlioides]|nr:putative choline transporter, neither null mutation nor overexpression affects choline transport [Aphanomyces cochlioides]